MASKYKRKIKRESIKASTSREGLTQGQVIDLEAIELHEQLTGISRSEWDREKLGIYQPLGMKGGPLLTHSS